MTGRLQPEPVLELPPLPVRDANPFPWFRMYWSQILAPAMYALTEIELAA